MTANTRLAVAALTLAALTALLLAAAHHQASPWQGQAARLEAEARECMGLAKKLGGEPARLLEEAAGELGAAARTLQHLKTTTSPTSTTRTPSNHRGGEEACGACTHIEELADLINKTIEELKNAMKYYESLEAKAKRAATLADSLISTLYSQKGSAGSVVGPLGVDYAEMLAKATEAIESAAKLKLYESKTVLNYAQAILALSQAVHGLAETCSQHTCG